MHGGVGGQSRRWRTALTRWRRWPSWQNRQFIGHGDLAADHAGGLANQLEIKVDGQFFKGQEWRGANGRFVRAFEDGRSLVDFVKHGLVDHPRSCLLGLDILRPKELALE